MKKNIIFDGIVYATYFTKYKFKKNLKFFSEDKNFLQIGTWSYDKNHLLARHYHKKHKKVAYKTNEFLYIVNGSLKCFFFGKKNGSYEKKYFKSIKLEKNDFIIIYEGAHSYKALTDETNVIEIKNGPYFGPVIDRKRF